MHQGCLKGIQKAGKGYVMHMVYAITCVLIMIMIIKIINKINQDTPRMLGHYCAVALRKDRRGVPMQTVRSKSCQ